MANPVLYVVALVVLMAVAGVWLYRRRQARQAAGSHRVLTGQTSVAPTVSRPIAVVPAYAGHEAAFAGGFTPGATELPEPEEVTTKRADLPASETPAAEPPAGAGETPVAVPSFAAADPLPGAVLSPQEPAETDEPYPALPEPDPPQQDRDAAEPALESHSKGELAVVATDPVVKAQVVVGENSRQVLQEWRTPLPEGALKVRDVTHRVVEVECKLLDDKVIVQALLDKQIFFVGHDALVHHLGERVPISTFVDIPGARAGMHCQPKVTAQILFHLEDSVLVQKILLDVFAKVTQREKVNLVEQPGGLSIKALVEVADVIGQMVEEIPVTLSVPAIKVVEIRVSVPEDRLVVEPIDDKVIIQGVIHKQIFFIDETNVERHQEVEVPFSHFVEAPGTRPEHVVLVEPEVIFTSFELLFPEGALATTQLLEKVVVEFRVNVAERRIMDVAPDPEGVLIKAEVVLGQGSAQILLERDVTLSVPALKVSDVLARVEQIRAVSLPGKVLVQGVVHKQIFFVGLDDGLEHHQAELIPFSTVVEVLGSIPDLLVQVTPSIEHVQTELISPTQAHQKIILRLEVVVAEEQQVRLRLVPYPYPL